MAVYIPEEIILQILYKLPIKSLLRFTCVSKTWLSLTKSPTFISSHLKHSNKNNPLLLLRYRSCHNVRHQYNSYPSSTHHEKYTEHYSLYLDNKDKYSHYMDLHFPFNDTHNRRFKFRIVGTVNGLVCVADDLDLTIVIWNPLIKKSVTLPKPSTRWYTCVSYGFGFDSSSNDYKVLRLFRCLSLYEDEDTVEAEIYSLNTNSWKRIRGPRYNIRNYDPQFFVNGVMHVLAFRELRLNEHCNRNLILGFDLADEVFREIALPQSLADGYGNWLRVFVYKELIAVLEDDSVGPADGHLWVMGEYGVVESWTKILSLDRQEGRLLRVLGFGKNGELFLHWYVNEITSYNHDSRESKSLKVSGSKPFVDHFVGSMELLDDANAQSDPTVEKYAIGDAASDSTATND